MRGAAVQSKGLALLPRRIDGFLVITHGVGAMRKYAIGAMLPDRTDPRRVLGRTPGSQRRASARRRALR